MADFLSRLIERSAGTATVARPVVAPLFAPGPAMAVDAAPEGPEPVGVLPQEPAPFPAPMPKAPATMPREAPAADPAALRPVRPPAGPAAAISGETAAGALRPAAVAPPEVPCPVILGEDPRSRVVGLPVAAPPPSPGAGRPAAVPRRSPAPQDSQRWEARIPAVTTSLLRPRQENAPRWAEAPLPRGTGDGSPAPIVRISIGRIEVRAVPPPGAAAPRLTTARKRTGPSLEEYLKPRGRVR
jgi:hypothetical protein